jgi:hypothetical protein
LLVADAMEGITQSHAMNPLQLLESRAKLRVRQIEFRTLAGEYHPVAVIVRFLTALAHRLTFFRRAGGCLAASASVPLQLVSKAAPCAPRYSAE